ncbi:MAG: transposase [Promethearchaeati archaeon SRVP18_Atabeyarchaeia-1]
MEASRPYGGFISRSTPFSGMQAVKAVKQNYTPSPELLNLLDAFRKMVNDCLRIGVAENVTSMKALSKKAYHQLAGFDVPAYYRLTAISKAAGILRNYRQALRKREGVKKPCATRLMLTDCYGFRIIKGKLRLPIRAREYVYLPLNAYSLQSVEGCAVRSVCLTASAVSLAFTKEVAQVEPVGLVGVDRNLDNVTTASSAGDMRRYDLSRATEIKENCRQAKRGLRRSDCRVRKQLYSKYGRIQRSKVNWILHNTSASIVKEAKERQFGIVMEDIRGIRKLYRKGNWQGKDYRARMNSWSYAELQRQIEYKARWDGIPVFYVNPSKTSSICAICGSKIVECAGRKVYCPRCRRLVDRDENGALNIVGAGLRFSLKGAAGEAVKGNPEERKEQVILGVDATQLTHHPKS